MEYFMAIKNKVKINNNNYNHKPMTTKIIHQWKPTTTPNERKIQK